MSRALVRTREARSALARALAVDDITAEERKRLERARAQVDGAFASIQARCAGRKCAFCDGPTTEKFCSAVCASKGKYEDHVRTADASPLRSPASRQVTADLERVFHTPQKPAKTNPPRARRSRP